MIISFKSSVLLGCAACLSVCLLSCRLNNHKRALIGSHRCLFLTLSTRWLEDDEEERGKGKHEACVCAGHIGQWSHRVDSVLTVANDSVSKSQVSNFLL